MKRSVLAAILVAGFALVAAAGPVQAGNGGAGGLAVGQNPLRLSLTQCSNFGGGNVADGLRWGLRGEDGQLRLVSSECLAKKLARYSIDDLREADARLGDINYVIIYPDLRAWLDDYYVAAPA